MAFEPVGAPLANKLIGTVSVEGAPVHAALRTACTDLMVVVWSVRTTFPLPSTNCQGMRNPPPKAKLPESVGDTVLPATFKGALNPLNDRWTMVEYELPSVRSGAAGLRVAGLLDKIGRTPYDALREHLVKMLTQSIWRGHPHVKTIRAIFGSIRLPCVSEFEHGQRESYEFLYAYDFSLTNEPSEPKDR